MAMKRSKLSGSVDLSNLRAIESTLIPFWAPTWIERGSAGLPACQPPVPQESTMKLLAMLRSLMRCTKIASASGERQMLPRQTKRMRVGSVM